MNADRRRLWSSRSPGKVVVRYAEGKILKGYTYDFEPEKPRFHLVAREEPVNEGIEVCVKDLKAVFFRPEFRRRPWV